MSENFLNYITSFLEKRKLPLTNIPALAILLMKEVMKFNLSGPERKKAVIQAVQYIISVYGLPTVDADALGGVIDAAYSVSGALRKAGCC